MVHHEDGNPAFGIVIGIFGFYGLLGGIWLVYRSALLLKALAS